MNNTFESLSTKGVSLETALLEAKLIQDRCRDFTIEDVTNKNCYFSPVYNGLQFSYDGEKVMMPMTRHSMSQLCSKLNIPFRYMSSLIDNGYSDLASENINAMLDDYHKNLLIRGYENSVRGVLSDRYSMMDAPDIADVLTSVFGDSYMVKGLLINPERMHIRIVQNEMMNVKGEDLYAGVTVDSSDVGRSTLSIRFFVYKQVCTNGLSVTKAVGNIFTQRHVGLTKDEFYSELVNNLSRVPTITEQVAVLIEDAKGYDKGLIDFDSFDRDKMVRFVNRVRSVTRLTDSGVEKVLDTMYNKYSVSRWGFINSLTEVAQDFTLERRLEIENAAGNILLNGNLLHV